MDGTVWVPDVLEITPTDIVCRSRSMHGLYNVLTTANQH